MVVKNGCHGCYLWNRYASLFWLQMVFVLLSMYFQSRLILAQYGSVRWPLPQAQVLEIFSRTQRLVFLREFRFAGCFNVSAITCPLQANINSIGSLARQIQRGSKSQEILGQTVKNFAAVESTVISTENNIAKLQVQSCFLQFFIKPLHCWAGANGSAWTARTASGGFLWEIGASQVLWNC